MGLYEMKRLLATTLLSLFFTTVHAEGTDLRCQVNMDQKVDGVLFENKNGILNVSIDETTLKGAPYRFIRGTGISQVSVVNYKTNDTYFFSDVSNEKSWEITNKAHCCSTNAKDDRSDVYTTIKIDRYTGSIAVLSAWRNLQDKTLIVTELQGTCQKVDSSKKRF